MKRWQRHVLFVSLGLGVLLLGVVSVRVMERGRYAVALSTQSAGPDGTKGLYLVAQALGLRTTRWSQEFANIPQQAVLVAFGEGDEMPREISRPEAANLVKWVRGGGVLFVAGASAFLPEGLGVELGDPPFLREDDENDAGVADAGQAPDAGETSSSEDDSSDSEKRRSARVIDDSLGGVSPIVFRNARALTILNTKTTKVLMEFENASPAAVQTRVGKGQVIVFASASPFQNQEIAQMDGAVVFARLLRAGAAKRVIFDEYHLGVGSTRSIGQYLTQNGFGPFLTQLLLVALVAVWYVGSRFGSTRHVAGQRAGGAASYIAALSALFSKAKDLPALARIFRRDAARRIARFYRVDGVPEQQWVSELELRGHADAARAVATILFGSTTVGDDEHSFVRELHTLDETVLKVCAVSATPTQKQRKDGP